jgi:hypothetical protein
MVCAGGGARQADKRSVRHLNSSASGSVRARYWTVDEALVVGSVPPAESRSSGRLSLASWPR